MKLAPVIRFPDSAEHIVSAYHRYLESIAEWSDMLPTEANAQRFCELILIPAWQRREPILFAVMAGRIIGATFTTLPDPQIEYRIPFASGHGTWVAADCRGMGVARALMVRVREMLAEKGVRQQVGLVSSGNHVSRAAFAKLGFIADGILLRCEI